MATRLILNPVKAGDRAIKGIVFDMDGTLCLPQAMRDALGIDKSVDILDYVHGLPEDEQPQAHEKLENIERKAMSEMVPQPGLVELMTRLEHAGLKKAICTRNFPIPVNYLLENYLKGIQMDPVITREFKPPKPHPAGILAISKAWEVAPENLVMVGDSVDDMKAGFGAGAGTILLQSDVNTHLNETNETDWVVQSLTEIVDLVENGFEIKSKS